MKNIIIAGVVAALISAAAATAATTLVITSAQIKNGTIKLVDISASAKRGMKGNRGPRGLQGAPGAQGLPGPQGPQGVQSITGVSAHLTLAAGEINAVAVACPAGMNPVSGGVVFISGGGEIFIDQRSGNGWVAGGDNFDSTISADLYVYAYCSPNVTITGSSAIQVGRLVDAQRTSH